LPQGVKKLTIVCRHYIIVELMKKPLFTFVLLMGLTAAAVAVPQYLNFQGVLRDTDGNLVTGTKAMTFKIYDAATGGTEQFSMTSSEVTVSNGLYTVQLGPLGASELGSGSRWVEVTVGTQILLPRLEILGVAYAVTAASADYAAVAGTATTAATATTATTATSANAVNGPVSAEASGSNYALFVNGGKIGVKTGTNMSAGVGVISGSSQVTISNAPVTASSIILLTVGHGGSVATNTSDRALKVYDVNVGAGTFIVRTIDHSTPGNDIPFSYLIIN
jgi:hypothetical protein